MIEKIKLGRISFSDACWEKISDNAKNLITKLIAFESNDRPSAEEALKHPWITEISIQ
jgi:serine/threonine protein kinase